MSMKQANMNAMEKKQLCFHDYDGKVVTTEVMLKDAARQMERTLRAKGCNLWMDLFKKRHPMKTSHRIY